MDEGARPKVFVGQSAIGYYGDRGARCWTRSPSPARGSPPSFPAQWEAAEREVERLGIRTVILRAGLVLTKHGGLIKQRGRPSSSASAGRSGAASSSCPGSTSTTRWP